MSPMTFISRLAALVPAPRTNLVTYHGLLAPAAAYRSKVVPEPVVEREVSFPVQVEGNAVLCRGQNSPFGVPRRIRLTTSLHTRNQS